MVRTGGGWQHRAAGRILVSGTVRLPRSKRKIDRMDFEEICSKLAVLERRIEVMERRAGASPPRLRVVDPPASAEG